MVTDFSELRKKMLERTKKQVQTEFGEKEIHVIRASNALNDLETVYNLLYEHTKEWYHYHYPELESFVNDPETYLKIVYEFGSRSNFNDKLNEIVSDEEIRKKIMNATPSSIGAAVEEEIMAEIQMLALNALNIKQETRALEKLLEKHLTALAPNFTQVAGVSIAGRMISHTGSLEKLALLPAGAIQVLGAEKALFRHLKNKKALPPKHGYLFAHGMVRQLPAEKRGRMARTLATKLSLCVRTDFYNTETNIAEQIQLQLAKRLEQLKAAKIKNKPIRKFDNRPPRFERFERSRAPERSFPPREDRPFRQNSDRRPFRRDDGRKPFFDKRKEFRDDDKPQKQFTGLTVEKSDFQKRDPSAPNPERMTKFSRFNRPRSRFSSRNLGPPSRSDSRSDQRPNFRSDSRPSSRPFSRPNSRPDSRPSSRPDSRPDRRPRKKFKKR